MKIFVPTFLIAGALTCVTPASATVITLSFDQLQTGEDVLNYYNGGLGSLGTGPGPSDGVIFGSGWIAGPPDAYGVPGGKSVGISGTAVMNLPSGWSGPVSFYYSGSPLTVDFYATLVNGQDSLVATWILPGETTFSPAGANLPFFQSAVFQSSGTDRIDAITEGGFVIPEPGTAQSYLLGMVCILGLKMLLRRQGAPPCVPTIARIRN